MEETWGLEEIAGKEKFIIVDGSCHSLQSGRNFLWESYDVKDYVSLNNELVRDSICELTNFVDFLEQGNVFTLPCVVEELGSYEKGVAVKIKDLNSKSYVVPKFTRKRRFHNLKDKGSEARESLEELQELSWNMVQLASRKSVDIFDERYETLLDLVKRISVVADLKKIGDKYDKVTRSQLNPYGSDTDERLTSAVLYYAFFSDKFPTLVTKDTDFVSLLGCVSGILGGNEFLPYNQEFRDKFESGNPFNLYVSRNGKFNVALRDKKGEFYARVGFSEKSSSQDKADLKKSLKEYWKGNPLAKV